jgi:hypothetical protein
MFSSSSKHLDWLYGPISFLFNGYRGNFWVAKWSGLELKHSHLASVLRMKGAILLLPLYSFMASARKNLTFGRNIVNVNKY